jgi:NAD(P)H-hydrate repair Nnr-like enzyme with NAD(P)H-hydrate dehydratase domain
MSGLLVLAPLRVEAAAMRGAGRILRTGMGPDRARIAAARALAAGFGAFVTLKGAGTVVAAPDGRTSINPTGSPALATAGTGDVLAGMLGALLAQGFEPWQAVVAAVWLHGEAVHGLGDVGVVAGDVALRAADVLRGLRRR